VRRDKIGARLGEEAGRRQRKFSIGVRPELPSRRRSTGLAVVIVCVAALTIASALVPSLSRVSISANDHAVEPLARPTTESSRPADLPARKSLGTPPSRGRWFSGAWAGGGDASTQRVVAFGSWRGTPMDAATAYPEMDTWQELHDSNWHITTFNGFEGILSFGLPMLPEEDKGDFSAIVRGEHDWVYQDVARDLVTNGRGRSVVRIGWEANGDWFPWGASATDAPEYVAAYRHIVEVLHRVAPDLVIDFDLSCGTALRGQTDRLDALNLLYPGDDVVDLVGCDFFDWHATASTDEASWSRSIKPANAVGIQDVADFARTHGKGLTYPEWGLASHEEGGMGDNSFFIEKVRSFFEDNADILVLEGYFSEPETSLANSVWDPVQMPESARAYERLW
jgi:hypothetical protein